MKKLFAVVVAVFFVFSCSSSAYAVERTPIAVASNENGEQATLFAEKCDIPSVQERIKAIAEQIVPQVGPISEPLLAAYEKREDGKVVETLEGCHFLIPSRNAVAVVWKDSGEALIPMFEFHAPK